MWPKHIKFPNLIDRKPTVSAANQGQAVSVRGGTGNAGAGERGRSLGVVEEARVGLRLLQTGETFY